MTRRDVQLPVSGRAGPAPQRTNAVLDELVENASDIVVLNDRAGWIVAANRAARELGGYTNDDVARGVHLREVLAPHEVAIAMEISERAFQGLPIPPMYEREVVLRGERRRILELRSNLLCRDGFEPVICTVGRDITERRAAGDFQSGLVQVAQALLSAKGLDELAAISCAEVQRMLHLDGVYIWLLRDDALVGYAAAGRYAADFSNVRFPLAEAVRRGLESAGEVVILNHYAESGFADESARAAGVRALLIVPLRRQGAVLGLLSFADYTDPERFTASLGEKGMIFGAQIAVAIESALAREGQEEEGRVSTALLHVARAIREAETEAAVLPQITFSAREVIGCDWAALALWDPAREVFRLAAIEGVAAEMADELRTVELGPMSLGRLIGRVLAGEIVEIPEPRGPFELWERWQLSSLLVVPMLRVGRIVGALVVGYRTRRGAFSIRERRLSEGIAAQAAAAVENARLVEDLRRANQLKSEFLATMSHELRTPLSAILGYADLMHDGAMGPLTENQHEALARMRLNGRGLFELINTTLDAGRLESGRVELEPSSFQLGELLDELRHEFAVQAAHRKLTLQWPADGPIASLYTDRGKLKMVVRNLVDNAVKFTAVGSVAVTTTGSDAEPSITIAVRDTGAGIPLAELPSLFEMFRQGDGTHQGARSGVGLGLYLVRRYTELIGGRVRAESRLAEGSTFYVEIPRRLGGEFRNQ
ncbi:MAG: GAF domain-containing protein [Deltaproteobacteria bacterium]|nr:GAF domain-containing protein [Deltaproteobacteria bacterium]MBI3390411.1 GAF domain-containing protein [Deltaproteobacteria bacterium]